MHNGEHLTRGAEPGLNQAITRTHAGQASRAGLHSAPDELCADCKFFKLDWRARASARRRATCRGISSERRRRSQRAHAPVDTGKHTPRIEFCRQRRAGGHRARGINQPKRIERTVRSNEKKD
jgi:hypothetical protein